MSQLEVVLVISAQKIRMTSQGFKYSIGVVVVDVQFFHSCHVLQPYLITFIYSLKKNQNITHKLFWVSMNISHLIGPQIFHI